MILSDLIANDDFDINANVRVFIGDHNDGGEEIWSKRGVNSPSLPLCKYLDMNVSYITVVNNELIVEIKKPWNWD